MGPPLAPVGRSHPVLKAEALVNGGKTEGLVFCLVTGPALTPGVRREWTRRAPASSRGDFPLPERQATDRSQWRSCDLNPGPCDSETKALLNLSCHRASWSHFLPLASGLWKGPPSNRSIRGDVVLGQGLYGGTGSHGASCPVFPSSAWVSPLS